MLFFILTAFPFVQDSSGRSHKQHQRKSSSHTDPVLPHPA